jgi:ABC-type nitrate/sulfonate/bicarbonate transport system permease component
LVKLALFPLMMVAARHRRPVEDCADLLGCFFPIVINTYSGVRNVAKYFVRNAPTKGANPRWCEPRCFSP